jgi:hypothetical protein
LTTQGFSKSKYGRHVTGLKKMLQSMTRSLTFGRTDVGTTVGYSVLQAGSNLGGDYEVRRTTVGREETLVPSAPLGLYWAHLWPRKVCDSDWVKNQGRGTIEEPHPSKVTMIVYDSMPSATEMCLRCVELNLPALAAEMAKAGAFDERVVAACVEQGRSDLLAADALKEITDAAQKYSAEADIATGSLDERLEKADAVLGLSTTFGLKQRAKKQLADLENRSAFADRFPKKKDVESLRMGKVLDEVLAWGAKDSERVKMVLVSLCDCEHRANASAERNSSQQAIRLRFLNAVPRGSQGGLWRSRPDTPPPPPASPTEENMSYC